MKLSYNPFHYRGFDGCVVGRYQAQNLGPVIEMTLNMPSRIQELGEKSEGLEPQKGEPHKEREREREI